MIVARIVLVVMIAVSVAMVPAVGGAAMAAKASDVAMSVTDHGASPCEKAPGDKASDNCKIFAGCALKCFNFPGAIVFNPLLPPPAADTIAASIETAFLPHIGGPPTRPPPR